MKIKNRYILILLFFAIRLLILFLVASYVPKILSYKGNFSFSDVLSQFNLPKFILAFANFDGIHYIKIATIGYYEYSQAFFPLYPLLINFFKSFLWGNRFWSGFLISNISFLIGLFFLKRIVKNTKLEKTFFWTLLFLLSFPTSFFFHTLYTESLFFTFFILCTYFLKEKKHLESGLTAIAASATRLVGVFLFIPIFLNLYPNLKRKEIIFVFFPFLGLLIYIIYLFQTTGDPLAFINAQQAFGAGRSTHIILLPQVYFRYLKIFFTAKINFQYFVSLLEFSIFSLVFFTSFIEAVKNFKRKDYFFLSIALFSLANILLPTFTGTFLSIPRFALLSLSTFIFLANIRNNYLKATLVIFFATLQIILFAFFVQGYFVS